jgi:hypothetical protein
MKTNRDEYVLIIAESYFAEKTSGLHGEIHVRLVAEQEFSQDMNIECPNSLTENYPVGTKFRLRVKLTSSNGKGILYSHYNWKYEVL